MSLNSENIKIFFKKLGIKVDVEKLYFTSGKTIRITCAEYIKEAEKLRAVHGIAVFRKGNVLNPTSTIVFAFGHLAKNRIKLEPNELEIFLEKGEIQKELKQHGYVLIEFCGKTIALGFYKNGKLRCFMPKEIRKQVLEAFRLKYFRKQNPPL